MCENWRVCCLTTITCDPEPQFNRNFRNFQSFPSYTIIIIFEVLCVGRPVVYTDCLYFYYCLHSISEYVSEESRHMRNCSNPVKYVGSTLFPGWNRCVWVQLAWMQVCLQNTPAERKTGQVGVCTPQLWWTPTLIVITGWFNSCRAPVPYCCALPPSSAASVWLFGDESNKTSSRWRWV